MLLRRPKIDDITEMEDIAKTSITGELIDKFETAAVVEGDDSVKAFGVTRTILEAVFYSNATDREKVEALRKLVGIAKSDAVDMGYDQLFIFVEPDFAGIMKKQFGFRDAKGIPLILDL